MIIEKELVKKILLFNVFAILTLIIVYRSLDLIVVTTLLIFIVVTTLLIITLTTASENLTFQGGIVEETYKLFMLVNAW
jgi:hypothetical protein